MASSYTVMSFLPLTFECGRRNHRIFLFYVWFNVFQNNKKKIHALMWFKAEGVSSGLLYWKRLSCKQKKTQFICWSNMDGYFIVSSSLCCKHFTANNSALKLTMLICISNLISNIFGHDISREVHTLKDILWGVILNYKENFHTVP